MITSQQRTGFGRRARVLPSLLLLLALASPAAGLTDAEREAAVKLYDAIGYPDTKELPFVRVAVSWFRPPDKDEYEVSRYEHGFLLSEDEKQYVVFTIHLETQPFAKATKDLPAYMRTDYERLDFRKWAEAWFADQKKIPVDEGFYPEWWSWRDGNMPQRKTRLFIVARALERRGHKKLSRAMMAFAATVLNHDESLDGEHRRSLLASLIWELSELRRGQLLDAFVFSTATRVELLKMHERYVANFGGKGEVNPDHAVEVQSAIGVLKQMIAQDRAHAKRKRRTWEKSTTEQRIAELIYQLRNQTEYHWDRAAMAEAFVDFETFKTPQHLLVEFGFDAAPALIEALDDRGFAWSRSTQMRFDHDHPVARVGDMALEALEWIAARKFGRNDRPTPAEAKQRVLKWWRDVQARGEQAVLADAVRDCGPDLRSQAWRLVARYPDAAVEPIVAAITRHKPDQGAFYSLMDLAQRIDDPRIDAALKQAIAQSDVWQVRLYAANCLHDRGDPAGVATMVGDFERHIDQPPDQSKAFMYLESLCNAADPRALDALARHLHRFEPSRRYQVISSLASCAQWVMNPRSYDQHVPEGAARAAVLTRIATILVGMLGDTSRYEGLSSSVRQGGRSVPVHSPRLRDIAANRLSVIWPGHYEFDIRLSEAHRDVMCAAMRAKWREAVDQPSAR